MILLSPLPRIARAIGRAALPLLAVAGIAGAAHAQTQTVRNTATLTYAASGGDTTVSSNTVEFTRHKFASKVSFRRLPVGWTPDFSNVHCTQRPNPTLNPVAMTAAELAMSTPLASLNVDNPFIMVLDAQGENHDPNVRETTIVNAAGNNNLTDVILTETGANTGVFVGAFPPVPHNSPTYDKGPCNVTGKVHGTLVITFPGDDDDSGATANLLIDPLGHVFDSQTGKALNGASVTVIDDATGLPAAVLGDDGVTAYPSTMITGQDVYDASGWHYAMEEGDFRFPLLAPGKYRLVVTPPAGYTAPSKASPDSLSGLLNPHGVPFTVNAASYGGAFTLSDPNPVTIDIPVDPKATTASLVAPRLILDKQASVREAELGDVIQYRIEIRNTGTGAASALVIADTLPQGLRYKRGTTKGAAEPSITSDGRHLSFNVGALAAGGTTRVTYLVEVVPGAPQGEAVNRATVESVAEHSVSNESSASVRIRAPLFTDGFTVIGRVTEGACGDPERGRKGVAGIRLLMEDGTYVVTDKDGFYHFEGVTPGTHVVQLDLASVPATHAPVTCDVDTRAAGNPLSRFVEAGGGSLQRVDFQLRPTGKAAVATDALPIAVTTDAAAAGNRDDWLDQAKPGIGWLFPKADHNPRAPAVRVVIAHGPDQSVALTINGKPVDPLSFDGTDSNRERNVAVSRWTGLPLVEGDNKLEARVLNGDGTVATTITRIVHYANTPANAVYAPEASRLVADGLTKPLIAVRVTDRAGRPVREGAIVAFRVEQPYRAAQASAAEQGRQLAGMDRTATTATVVGDDGIAFIALDPTRQPGLARVTIAFASPDRGAERSVDIKAWLAAPAQDWVVVGFLKGTLSADLQSPKGDRADADGQIAFYAKGRIHGAWVVTAAYDSAKTLQRMRERGVLGTIDPDRYYTVYGDGTAQAYDAASRRKLYVRLERREIYAMFGDFETGLVDTRLGRYSRTLTGVKGEYAAHGIRFTGFAANDDSRYARDEIQGNGLSGPYRLSNQNIMPNSDKLRLETRDRLRPELVVESRDLTRHIDYDIDPDAGTIRFKEPILSRDSKLNPVFIVADYELQGNGNKLVAGGRASVTVGRVEAGASVIHDETDGNATVAAVDLRARISGTTEVRAEAAKGGRQGLDTGHAWLAEIEHRGTRADVLVYAREQSREFGLGQQNFGEAGSRKIGFDGRIRLNEMWSIAGSAWHQRDLTGGAERIAGDARIEYRTTAGTLYAGFQFASDRGVGTNGDEQRDSRLLTLGGTKTFFNKRLELTGESQIPLGGKDDSVDFPARQRIQAAWRFNESIRLIAGYEVAKGDKFSANTARIGFDLTPWTGGRVMAAVNQGAIGENGGRTFAQYGLAQSLQVSKRWTIDATLDSSSTLGGGIPASDVVNSYHPVASGGFLGTDGIDGDFVAVTLGATYRGDRWSWNGRAEYRDGPREQRWGLTSNLLQSLGNGSTLASSVRAYRLREQSGSVSTSIRADLALAIRPVDSDWAVLERFQVRSESAGAGTTLGNALAVPTFASDTRTTFRAINNLALNYRTGGEGAGHGFEASLYYGAKYVRGRYADEKFEGFVDVVGLEIRKDIDPHFDIGVQGSAQHSWSNGTVNFSLGASLGFSPTKDVWVSAGYNVAGYRDRDFEDSRYTRQGPFVTVRMKFDQGMFGGLLGGRK